MARILEALSRAQPHKLTSAAERPTSITEIETAPIAAAAPTPPSSPASAPETMPFIEVGNGPMTASASVMSVEVPVGFGVVPPPRPAPVNNEPGIAYKSVSFRQLDGLGSKLPLPGRFAPALVAYHQPDSDSARQYRALLADVLSGLNAREEERGLGRVLLFSGCCAEAGTTTVVLNLALAQARPLGEERARRGVVVDAVTRCPGVHRQLGLNASPGLAEVLCGAVPLHRAVRDTGVPYCQALSAGETGKPTLVIKSLLATLAQLRKRFELIFVDAPCWSEQPGMAELAAACDALYLVVPRARASATETNELVERLPGLGVPLRGCVLAEK